jgi:hypothetical protein
MKITKSQLVEAIEKEVVRLNKISIMENRLTELNRERKILSEGNISPEDITSNPAIKKLTQNPEFQNVIKYLKQHPEEVDALEDDEDDNLDNINEGDLPSVSPEALIEPMETEVVQNFDGEDIDGVELIELTLKDEEKLFGEKKSPYSEKKMEDEGIMATMFPDIFSREAMESYEGKKIDDYFLPIQREQLWFRLIEPIAFHYMYGAEGKWYSKSEAANMAKERGKKYVIAQYMS